MKLMDYTTPGGFLPKLDCDSVAAAVERLVNGLVEAEVVGSAEELAREIMRRENEGSTAIGGGLVIPHARFKGVREVRLAVATLADPVDIPSEDGLPVDVVILLVGPEGDPRQMLRVLARLARLVRQESFLQSLRNASTPDALRAAFSKVG
ncbi:MAG: PTS sugar transporter subunit IIA [Candidatus Krumholzibacteriota bacterium]